MKNKPTVLFILLFLLVTSFTNLKALTPDPKILVRVELSDIEDIRLLDKNEFQINLRYDDFVVVTTTSADLDFLKQNGLRHEILDQNAWTQPYFLLSKPLHQPLGVIPDYIQIISQKDDQALVKVAEDRVEALQKAGFRLINVSSWSLPATVQMKKDISDLGIVTLDNPVVMALMNQVSVAALTAGLTRLQNFKTRYTGSDSIYSSGKWLLEQFKKYGYQEVFFDTIAYKFNNKKQRNIIAIKRGKKTPDKFVVIGGHYDSIVNDGNDPMKVAPGVDDNASGAFAALESARILSKIDLDKSVIFACWAAEEQGLIGSNDWVSRKKKAGMDIELYINFDMISYVDHSDPVRDYTIAATNSSRAYADIMSELARTHTTLVPQIIQSNSGQSDHWPFQQNGYNIVYGFASDFSSRIYHTQNDVIENVDISYYREVVQVGLGTLALVAGPPESISDAVISLHSTEIDDDNSGQSQGNGNHALDPGEKVELYATLQNVGNTLAADVTATLSTDNPHVSILNGVKSYNNIAAGDLVKNAEPFVFSISSDAVNDELLMFSIKTKDAQNKEFENFILLRVQEPEMVFHSSKISEVVGDGDNIPDPGELCNLILYLDNNGFRTAQGVSATLSTRDTEVFVTNPMVNFVNADTGQVTHNEANPFVFSIAPKAENHAIEFVLNLTEGGGYYQKQINIRVLIGQGPVLLVADNGTGNDVWNYLTALNEIGVPARQWSVKDKGVVPADTLKLFEDVVWYTGSDTKETLSQEEQDNLKIYLDNGGHLLLSGDFIGFRLSKKDFYSDYLYSKFVSFQTLLFHLKSVPENPITEISEIELEDIDGNWPTEIDPIEPAFSLFTYNRQAPEGPGTVLSSGSGAIAVDNGKFKVVNCSFRFETIIPVATRANLLADILSWFKGAPINLEAKLSVAEAIIDDDSLDGSLGDGDGFINPGETVQISLNVANAGFADAREVQVTLRTKDPLVTIPDSTVTSHKIGAKSETSLPEDFVIKIDPAAVHNHLVRFTVLFADTANHTWSDDLNLRIQLSNSISGQVVDVGTGLGIPFARIGWNNVQQSITDTLMYGTIDADMEGKFLFALPIGPYEMAAGAEGFVTSEIIHLVLPPDTTLNFVLTSPALSIGTESIAVNLEAGESRKEKIILQNQGTGILHYSLLELPTPTGALSKATGKAGKSISEIRLKFNKPANSVSLASESMIKPDPTKWQLVQVDQMNEGVVHDLHEFYIQQDAENLWFKQTVYKAWGTPSKDFMYAIFLDTDLDLNTGLQVSLVGADFVIVLGMQGSYVLQYMPEVNDLYPVSGNPAPHHIVLRSRTDSLEVGIRKAQINIPEQFRVITAMVSSANMIEDYMPKTGLYCIPYSTFDATWLGQNKIYGQIQSTKSDTILINFNTKGLSAGIYKAQIKIESNQPGGEPKFIPVRLDFGLAGLNPEGTESRPKTYALEQNFPNPFSVAQGQKQATFIKFQLPEDQKVTLKIYNMLGQVVASVIQEDYKAGFHQVNWNGRLANGNLIATGIYFYKLQAGDFIQTRKMLIIR